MRRALLALVLPLALAACTPDLAPEDAREAARSAAASGEGFAALRYLKAAAEGGDLDAMRTVAGSYESGYLSTTWLRTGDTSTNLPVLALPGQARSWRARYERERDARAASGDPAGWMRVAEDLSFYADRETADWDSARAIHQRLGREGHVPAILHLAFNENRENPAARDSLLRVAEAAGSAVACEYRIESATWGTSEDEVDTTVVGSAALLDELETCPPKPASEPRSIQIVRSIKTGAARGDSVYVAHLDSLRALGVFERHPRLAAVRPE